MESRSFNPRTKAFLVLFVASLACLLLEDDIFSLPKRLLGHGEHKQSGESRCTAIEPLAASNFTRRSSSSSLISRTTETATGLCGFLDYPNTEDMWERLAPLIQRNSLPETDFFPVPVQTNIRNHPNLTAWVNRTWNFFRPRMYRSELHRMAEPQLLALKDVLERKISNQSEPPLQVLVVGGSPTLGHGCPTNPYIPLAKEGNFPFPECAWSARLQDMLDAILGAGVVKIHNVAAGGTTTDISTLVFEYGLWPTLPDVVINAHSINDAIKYHTLSDMLQARETFQKAVEQSRCDSDLPAVIHLDDFIAEDKISTMDKTFVVADCINRISMWHDTMAVSYSNAVRSHVLSHLYNASSMLEIFGTPLSRHPGFMFHVSIAWTVLYNVLGQLSRVCRSGLTMPQGGWEKSPQHIPPLNESLRTYDVSREWDSTIFHAKDSCSSRTIQPCSYAWMSHRTTGIRDTKTLHAVMDENLIQNDRWAADGYPGRSPKLGWDAKENGAKFTLRLPVDKGGAQFLTIVVMESYGDKWLDAKLSVELREMDQTSTFTTSLTGYHSKRTSVSVPHKIELPSSLVESNVLIASFTLVAGSTFKILGIALCSR